MEKAHYYKLGERGRGQQVDPTNGQRTASVTCSGCSETGSVSIKSLLPPEVIDKKFIQKGWKLDPHICPDCIASEKQAKLAKQVQQPKKEQPEMTVTKINTPLADNPVLKAVSIDTHKATAKMHRMLTEYFDADDGVYIEGWNDDRIAKESGMSASHVTEVRNLAYGELKEPDELVELKRDIKALNDLITETLVSAQKEVNALNKRVDEVRAKFGFK